MSKQEELDAVAKDIIKKGICKELAEQANQLVMGSGSVDAQIVFIGEAPGKQEDLHGKPFIGASGKFLDEMLANAGMKREDVYITNIVKYRPPSNRDPKKEEKQQFMPYLLQQLAIIEPKLIVTLGKHAMETFFPKGKISELHGKPKRLALGRKEWQMKNGSNKLTVLPLYHPAAALYNGSMRSVLLDDFANVPNILDSIN